MASDIKLRSVVNDNSLKGSTTYTPRSTVYVETSNTLGPLEDVMDATDANFSINNLHWGSTGIVRIPPSFPLIKLVSLHLKLKHTYAADGAYPGHTPDCTYQIYRLLKNFRYRLGNSDQVNLQAVNIPFIVNDYCDTQAKREALLEAAGEGFNMYPSNVAIDKEYIYLSGILPLPWSNPSLWKAPKPVPLYMTNQSLELSFEWEEQDNVKNLLTAGDGSTLTIENATVKLVYEQLGSFNQLKSAPYLYPFQYYQDNIYPVKLMRDTGKTTRYPAVPNSDDTASKQPLYCTFNMVGLRQGETSQFTIRLALREKIFRSKARTIGANSKWQSTAKTTMCNDIYKGVKLSMISVKFGGQEIYRADVEDSTSILESFYNFLPSALPGRKRFINGGNFARVGPLDTLSIQPLVKVDVKNADGTTNSNVVGTESFSVDAGDHVTDQYKGAQRLNRPAQSYLRSATVIEEPFDLLNKFRDNGVTATTGNFKGRGHVVRTNEPSSFYYHIPIAQILDHIRGQDYSLGADFDKGEIQCTVWVDTDYYRQRGQWFWVHEGDAGALPDGSNVVKQIGAVDAPNNPGWVGKPNPDMAYQADIIDGKTWLENFDNYQDYSIYALASTNAIYHFSGQNVTRIS